MHLSQQPITRYRQRRVAHWMVILPCIPALCVISGCSNGHANDKVFTVVLRNARGKNDAGQLTLGSDVDQFRADFEAILRSNFSKLDDHGMSPAVCLTITEPVDLGLDKAKQRAEAQLGAKLSIQSESTFTSAGLSVVDLGDGRYRLDGVTGSGERYPIVEATDNYDFIVSAAVEDVEQDLQFWGLLPQSLPTK